MKRFATLPVLLACWSASWAQPLEIITLMHRPAEQLLPALQPLIEPGGTLTGTGDKLFLRASSRNAADIRRVIGELDRPLRRLMITVRQGGQRESEGVGAGGTVRLAPGDSSVRARIGETRSTSRQDIAQQVQTVEGGRAFINVGQSLALPLRQVVQTPAGVVVSDTLVWRDIGTGFHAAPRLSGDRVTLDISPTHDTPGNLPGSANIQHMSTTVSGRLGEWLALGGSAQDTATERSGTLHYSARGGRDDRQVWLKVEELSP